MFMSVILSLIDLTQMYSGGLTLLFSFDCSSTFTILLLFDVEGFFLNEMNV